jgi:hypothetical protein
MNRHTTDYNANLPNANRLRANVSCWVMEEIDYFTTILIERHKHATFKPAQEVHLNL